MPLSQSLVIRIPAVSARAIAFVLLEDGMTGTTDYWRQLNALSHRDGYEKFEFWYNAGTVVTGLEYDHVPVGAWDILNGVDNSVPTSFTADEKLPFSYQVSIADKTTIQNKKKLSAVALLIDRSNGAIINAAQTKIADATGIESVKGSTVNSQRSKVFDLQGREVAQPTRGLYLVDGKKVVIK